MDTNQNEEFSEFILNKINISKDNQKLESESFLSIRQERDLLDSIMESSSTAITLLSPMGKIIYANKAAERVLGIKISDITSRSYDSPQWKASAIDGTPWLDKDQPFVRVLKTGESVTDIRHAIEDEHGNKKYLSINGAPIKNEKGDIIALTFLVTDITDSILKEKKLIESEFKYRKIVEQTLSMVYDLDVLTGKIQWAGAVFDLTGFSVDYLNNHDIDFWSSSIHPEDRDRVLEEINICMKENKRFVSEYRFKTKSGEYKYFEDNGIFIYDKEENPVKMLGAMIDRTERKAAEESLILAQERLRLALEAAKMGTWLWNIKEDRIEWSEHTYEIFELKPSNLILKANDYLSFVHPDYRTYFGDTVFSLLKDNSQSQANEFTVVHKIVTAKGTEKWVEGHGKLIRDSLGAPEQMIGTVTDITDRKWQEEQLRISEERFQAFYHFTNEAIIVTEKGTRKIVDVNSAFMSLFGYFENSWLGLRINDLVTRNSVKLVRELYDANISDKKVEMEGIRKDGSIFPVLVSTSHYLSESNEYVAYTVIDISSLKEVETLKIINNDIQLKNILIEKQKNELELAISDLKKTQAQLIQSEKMAALGQLVAGIAHEVNNPVAAIKVSNQNIIEWYKDYKIVFPEIQKELMKIDLDERINLIEMIEDYAHKGEFVTGRQAKSVKEKIYNILVLNDFTEEESDILAETFVEIGVTEIKNKEISLLKNIDIQKISEFILLENIFHRNVRTIKYAIDRVTKIVYALKNFTHIDNSGEKKDVNIANSIDIVLTIYQNQIKKGIEIIREIREDVTIKAYSDDILHIWTNLIYNSIQAMDYSGRIFIRVFREKEYAVVEIEDNGSGIPMEIQSKVFDPFFTTKLPGEGSGIGLDIVKKIINKHDGSISFTSHPGRTIFHVKLPIN